MTTFTFDHTNPATTHVELAVDNAERWAARADDLVVELATRIVEKMTDAIATVEHDRALNPIGVMQSLAPEFEMAVAVREERRATLKVLHRVLAETTRDDDA